MIGDYAGANALNEFLWEPDPVPLYPLILTQGARYEVVRTVVRAGPCGPGGVRVVVFTHYIGPVGGAQDT